MSECWVSDPSKLHLKKKDLTQIRKAARVLRDPGTTSSWKSPLSSSRSVTAASASAWKSNFYSGKENVFLYNWKNHKSSGDNKSGLAKNDNVEEEDDGDDEDAAGGTGNDTSSSSLLGSFEDTLSDARGCDSKSDSHLRVGRRSSIFRCTDANRVSSARRKMGSIRRKSKKTNRYLNNLSRYRQPETNLGRKFVNSKIFPEDSVEQSDDTEDYSNSEDLSRILGSSRLLLKLKRSNWSRSSSKLLRSSRTEDSYYTYSTPALSTCSHNRYGHHNSSTVGSWEATASSLNDGDDEVDDHLNFPGQRGCGIPCCWSKRTPKHRGMCRSCYSPSLSETLRRKGSSLFCGSKSIYTRHRRSLSSSNKWRVSSRIAQGVLPLLPSSGDVRGGSSVGSGRSDDELSTNLGELYLEGLSRLDGRRWSSSCRSQDGLGIVAVDGEGDEEGTLENARSFSQKYKPISFGDLIGQNIVVQSLMNAISRNRIAPVYLFQGPRGIGKTSTARIFAAALNCMAPDVNKPCGYCRNCTDLNSGKSRDFLEVDGTNKKGIDSVRYLLKRPSAGSPSTPSRYNVFVIDECHLLPSKTWLAFLKFLEEPPNRVVFILITTDLDNVPLTIQSRSQKYLFNKIKDADIVARLTTLSAEENLDVEKDALDLIAMNADGSLQDAETMLEQLSLLGKRITTSLVNELVGVISDEKLLELLELAMSSDTTETVKRAREVIDSVADPMALISQMACLIMDIIAGSYAVIDTKPSDSCFGARSCFLVAYVAFGDRDIKIRAERFLSSITNSMEMVLRCNVEVRIIHLLDDEGENLTDIRQAGSTMGSEKLRKGSHTNEKGSHSRFPPLLDENLQAVIGSSDSMAERTGVREDEQVIPAQRVESIIREQRLETAWLQAVEKGSPGSLSHARPEKNQVLPQENVICKDLIESIDSTRFSSQHREDDLHHEVKVLKVKHGRILQNGARCPMSPSLLHGSSLAKNSSKDNLGYESGSGAGGCIGLICWNNCKRRRVKVRTQNAGHFTLFSECGKSMKKEIKR
ncbi:protein STICHEL-like isoform X2 [Prosopis cineraria]|uniref:protein STICHEL-like isoform X2 n=1 Tax=Prosopis cineraria TaxID=364024 RepID=UPI00240FDAA4|nr:protein STICHEL-like isoform X2 [Prosopis cineraria]